MSGRAALRIGAVAWMLTITACVTPDKPLLSLGSRSCDPRPQLDGARPVPFDRSAGAKVKLDENGRCLNAPGAAAPTTYAVFRLPDAPLPYAVTITSLATRSTLVSPRVTLYNEAGVAGRTLAPEGFQPGVTGLRAGLRLKGGERWLVAEADRAMLGQPVMLRLGRRDPGGVQVASSVPIFHPAGPVYRYRTGECGDLRTERNHPDLRSADPDGSLAIAATRPSRDRLSARPWRCPPGRRPRHFRTYRLTVRPPPATPPQRRVLGCRQPQVSARRPRHG